MRMWRAFSPTRRGLWRHDSTYWCGKLDAHAETLSTRGAVASNLLLLSEARVNAAPLHIHAASQLHRTAEPT